MEWRVTRQNSISFNDVIGTIGGFFRGTTDEDATAIEIRSPDGTIWYIVVDDLGALTAEATLP